MVAQRQPILLYPHRRAATEARKPQRAPDEVVDTLGGPSTPPRHGLEGHPLYRAPLELRAHRTPKSVVGPDDIEEHSQRLKASRPVDVRKHPDHIAGTDIRRGIRARIATIHGDRPPRHPPDGIRDRPHIRRVATVAQQSIKNLRRAPQTTLAVRGTIRYDGTAPLHVLPLEDDVRPWGPVPEPVEGGRAFPARPRRLRVVLRVLEMRGVHLMDQMLAGTAPQVSLLVEHSEAKRSGQQPAHPAQPAVLPQQTTVDVRRNLLPDDLRNGHGRRNVEPEASTLPKSCLSGPGTPHRSAGPSSCGFAAAGAADNCAAAGAAGAFAAAVAGWHDLKPPRQLLGAAVPEPLAPTETPLQLFLTQHPVAGIAETWHHRGPAPGQHACVSRVAIKNLAQEKSPRRAFVLVAARCPSPGGGAPAAHRRCTGGTPAVHRRHTGGAPAVHRRCTGRQLIPPAQPSGVPLLLAHRIWLPCCSKPIDAKKHFEGGG
eukprot:gene2703-biopygen3553